MLTKLDMVDNPPVLTNCIKGHHDSLILGKISLTTIITIIENCLMQTASAPPCRGVAPPYAYASLVSSFAISELNCLLLSQFTPKHQNYLIEQFLLRMSKSNFNFDAFSFLQGISRKNISNFRKIVFILSIIVNFYQGLHFSTDLAL